MLAWPPCPHPRPRTPRTPREVPVLDAGFVALTLLLAAAATALVRGLERR
ncbi:hypothetical protein [Kineococcus gypseus]